MHFASISTFELDNSSPWIILPTISFTTQREQKELRGQVDKLVAKNKRLSRDLKEAIHTQLEQIDTGDLAPDMIGDEQVLHNLQRQLEMAVQVCVRDGDSEWLIV